MLRVAVAVLDAAGLTQIAIARQLNCAQPVVSRTLQRLKSDAPFEDKPRAGRPSKISVVAGRGLARSVLAEKDATAASLARELTSVHGEPVSPRTVQRHLHKQGLVNSPRIKKPYISEKNRRARLAWAKLHVNKPLSFWKKVLFSDESKINNVQPDGNLRTWHRPGAPLAGSRIRQTVKHPAFYCMIWGCISWRGFGNFTPIDGLMDAAMYQEILRTNMLTAAADVFKGADKDTWLFQQDNDPKHTATSTKEWFQQHGVRVLPWPSQSPDLNPIEHAWHYLKRRMAKEKVPGNVVELADLTMATVRELWEDDGTAFCQKLIESMPRRCQAVIDAKGGPTKY